MDKTYYQFQNLHELETVDIVLRYLEIITNLKYDTKSLDSYHHSVR